MRTENRNEIINDIDERTYTFLKNVINCFPFPVFIKDENRKYYLINNYEAQLFKLKEQEIIGKGDPDIIRNKRELSHIISSDEEVLKNNKPVELPNQNFTLNDGTSYLFRTHKIPFINPITGKRNILGFSIDVTDTVNLNQLKNIISLCSNRFE
ncbi:MAG: PAS domain-containing protein [Cytophagaceae bacterium]